jgi:hypothetical protein
MGLGNIVVRGVVRVQRGFLRRWCWSRITPLVGFPLTYIKQHGVPAPPPLRPPPTPKVCGEVVHDSFLRDSYDLPTNLHSSICFYSFCFVFSGFCFVSYVLVSSVLLFMIFFILCFYFHLYSCRSPHNCLLCTMRFLQCKTRILLNPVCCP